MCHVDGVIKGIVSKELTQLLIIPDSINDAIAGALNKTVLIWEPKHNHLVCLKLLIKSLGTILSLQKLCYEFLITVNKFGQMFTSYQGKDWMVVKMKKHICIHWLKNSYRKTSSISRTVVGNKIVDNSDVVGTSPVGAAPTTSSFSTQYLASMDWAKTTSIRYKKRLSFGI